MSEQNARLYTYGCTLCTVHDVLDYRQNAKSPNDQRSAPRKRSSFGVEKIQPCRKRRAGQPYRSKSDKQQQRTDSRDNHEKLAGVVLCYYKVR